MLRQPDLKAFKLPVAESAGKTTKQKNAGVKSAVRAALFGANKPTARGRDTKAGKRGLRQWKEPWTQLDLISLYFAAPSFQDVVNAGVIASNIQALVADYIGKQGQGEIRRVSTWNAKELARHRAVLSTQLVEIARSAPATVAEWIKRELLSVLVIVNESKMHPLDISDWVQGYVLNGTRGVFNASKMLESGARQSSMVQVFRTIAANRNRFVSAKSVLLRSVAQALEVQQSTSMLMGFHTVTGMKAWTPGKKAGTSLGLEIAGFKYRVPTKFDNEGKPLANGYQEFSHATGSERAATEKRTGFEAKTYGEYAEILSRTPAGRMWLCFNERGHSPFIAFDRSPRYPLFALDRHDPFIALLHGLSEQDMDKGLVGFIM